MRPPALVCVDPAEAAAAVAAGTDVVLLAPASVAAEVWSGRREGASHRGRLAVFVGDPASPTDRAAAAEMAAEVFARG